MATKFVVFFFIDLDPRVEVLDVLDHDLLVIAMRKERMEIAILVKDLVLDLDRDRDLDLDPDLEVLKMMETKHY